PPKALNHQGILRNYNPLTNTFLERVDIAEGFFHLAMSETGSFFDMSQTQVKTCEQIRPQ
ncbi:hypothetical protein Q8A64_18890, partial [Oxalobacteraceae bacterium R-40]|nr:hypothetical protein [Oxalobacteraceae bacterium R-40]